MHSIKLYLIIISILLTSCVQLVDEDNQSDKDTYTFTIEPNLEVDGNGFYHLNINRNNWQTIHRISGHVYINNGNPVENFWVEWDSNLYWYLGDTLGYIVDRYLNNSGVYVSLDTSYIIGFSGQEVPTSNQMSYSNSSGEVNNMIAPVRSMIGDTMLLNFSYYDGSGSISIILD